MDTNISTVNRRISMNIERGKGCIPHSIHHCTFCGPLRCPQNHCCLGIEKHKDNQHTCADACACVGIATIVVTPVVGSYACCSMPHCTTVITRHHQPIASNFQFHCRTPATNTKGREEGVEWIQTIPGVEEKRLEVPVCSA